MNIPTEVITKNHNGYQY